MCCLGHAGASKAFWTNAEWRQNCIAALPLHADGLTQTATRKVAQTLRKLPYIWPVAVMISAADCCYISGRCSLLPMLRMQCSSHMRNPSRWVAPSLPLAVALIL